MTNDNILLTMLCFCKQKNNDKGQTLTYHCHSDSHWKCPTWVSLNIVRQTHQLGAPSNSPTAVYHNPITSNCQRITALQVATFMWHVAHKVFNIPAIDKHLLTWSCHSIHIKAMNFLHCMQFSDFYIKNCLCWHSNTFLMYLRNTFYTANQHTKAITLGLDPPPWGLAWPLEPHESILSTGVA